MNLGWLDKLRHKISVKTKYADMLNGFTPIFSQFGNDIYASDVVQQAISCIVSEMKKLNPQHVRSNGTDVVPMNSSIQAVLKRPNEIMTTSEFIEKIVWQLFLNYNAFILPTYYVWTDEKTNTERRVYTGLYPIAPTQVDFIQDASDTLYVKLRFANNFETTIPYSAIIHVRHRFSVNEFMGGNELGQPDNRALLKTLELNEQLLQGVSKAMLSSFAVNGVVKYKSMIDGGKTEKALKELEQKLRNSESGFLPLDITSEFIPIERQIELVDEGTLKFIDEKILRHFSVPLCILTGDYTKEQYEAFYQKTLEPLIIALSQAFTRTLFTSRELSFGNEIKFYPKDLIFMSVDQTLEMVRLLGDSGSIYENEKRVAFGLRPHAELEGVRMQSLNYVNVDIASQYQVGQNKSAEGGTEDEPNREDIESDD
jgi:HK97 family phage portal protein